MLSCFPYMILRVLKKCSGCNNIRVRPSEIVHRYLHEIPYKIRMQIGREGDQVQEVMPAYTPEKCLAVVMLRTKFDGYMVGKCPSLNNSVIKRAAKRVSKTNGQWKSRLVCAKL